MQGLTFPAVTCRNIQVQINVLLKNSLQLYLFVDQKKSPQIALNNNGNNNLSLDLGSAGNDLQQPSLGLNNLLTLSMLRPVNDNCLDQPSYCSADVGV